MVKKILKIALWVITGVALTTLFVYGRRWYLDTPLKGIVFQLERDRDNGFVKTDSVMSYVEAISDIKHHAANSSVNLMKIRDFLNSNPWIESSSAYIGLNDTLIIHAKEYDPVIRVFNQDKRSVYVTSDGVVIPSSPNYAPHLIIASGEFSFPTPDSKTTVNDSVYANTGLPEALAIAKAIRNDQTTAKHIGQIYKNTNNKYELMVNNLPARVILGDTNMVANKLTRLGILLEKYGGTEELDNYKTLDLKYKNQIVCTK